MWRSDDRERLFFRFGVRSLRLEPLSSASIPSAPAPSRDELERSQEGDPLELVIDTERVIEVESVR